MSDECLNASNIKVTQRMVEAGANILGDWRAAEGCTTEYLVEIIYQAMELERTRETLSE